MIAKLRQSRAADLIASGAAWIGSPDEIIDQIRRTQQEFGGYEHASLQVNFNTDAAEAGARLDAAVRRAGDAALYRCPVIWLL